MKVYSLPPHLSQWIEVQLKGLGYELHSPQKLAKAVLEVSNDYQEVSTKTPWHRPEAIAAYLAYFFPLNYIRSLKVIDEGKKWGFFNDSENLLDFGCGPGTLTKALLDDKDFEFKKYQGFDSESRISKLYEDSPAANATVQFHREMPSTKQKNNLLLASYVLNELKKTPQWIFDFEKILIIEPSTKQAFPELLNVRDQLIEKKYFIVAPCPHSHQCPLQESKRDWCHDRVHWQQPEWFQRIENHLPIKNNTLTFSYLLASRKPLNIPTFARVVGDAQVEKGKTRWMICQGPEREFLSFLKRQGEAPQIHRGDRLQLSHFEKKGSELRFDLENLKKIEA